MDRPIKTLYRALPSRWVQPIRDVLEFAGGSMDTMLPRATSEETLFDKRPKFRVSPASPPFVPKVPKGEWRRVYDIKYYSRDPRNMRRDTLTIEDTMRLPTSLEPVKLLEAASKGALPEESAAILTPDKGVDNSSLGRPNKDVNRYSKDGLRSTMTASWKAMSASLEEAGPDHLPHSEWISPGAYSPDAAAKDWAAKGMLFGPLGRRRPMAHVKWTFSDRDTGCN